MSVASAECMLMMLMVMLRCCGCGGSVVIIVVGVNWRRVVMRKRMDLVVVVFLRRWKSSILHSMRILGE